MNAWKAIQIGCALVLGLALYLPGAHADARNEGASLTFSAPVQVSDTVILPAGTYWFQLADSTNYPNNTMEIFDNNGTHVTNVETQTVGRGLAPMRVFGNHDYGDFMSAKLEFTEGPDHDTLVKYFYCGDTEGHKFVYSPRMEKALSEEPMVTRTIVPRNHGATQTLSASNVH